MSIELTECLSVVFSNLCFAARGRPAVELMYHLTTGYLHDYHEIRGIGRNYIKSDKKGFDGKLTKILGGTFVVDAPANSASFFVQGGSFWIQGNDREFYGNTSAVSVYMVTVDGIEPNAKVAFDNLPSYYNTDEIYADAAGQVYLWLPENWETGHDITPRLLATPASGTKHTFAANGYSYTVTIDQSAGGAVAEKGEALQLEGLRIDGFAVADGWLLISLTASPATWLYGFADTLTVCASTTLPVPDDAKLDLSGAELRLEDGNRAVFAVPLDAAARSMFFRVGAEESR